MYKVKFGEGKIAIVTTVRGGKRFMLLFDNAGSGRVGEDVPKYPPDKPVPDEDFEKALVVLEFSNRESLDVMIERLSNLGLGFNPLST